MLITVDNLRISTREAQTSRLQNHVVTISVIVLTTLTVRGDERGVISSELPSAAIPVDSFWTREKDSEIQNHVATISVIDLTTLTVRDLEAYDSHLTPQWVTPVYIAQRNRGKMIDIASAAYKTNTPHPVLYQETTITGHLLQCHQKHSRRLRDHVIFMCQESELNE